MAGLEVAGWFASPLIDRVLSLAGSFFEQTCGSNQEADKLLFDLKISLLTVKGQIECLEMKPLPSQTLPEWLRELKDVTYEAFDVLDIIEYKNMSEKINHQSKVSMIASSSVYPVKTIPFSDSDLDKLKIVAHKLKTICGEVGNLVQLLNLKDNNDQRAKKRPKTSEGTHHLNDLKLFGRDEEINTILDMMSIPINNSKFSREDIAPSNKAGKLGKGKQPSQAVKKSSNNYPVLGVIPIVGIAGVGKTALAKVIYNNQSVKEHFDLRSWIYVPESKAIEIIFRGIIESTGTEWQYGFDAGLIECQNKFTRTINNKRILLVLDNMWEEDIDWEYLRRVLIKEVASGSIVIVTTQSHKVATEVVTMTQIRLNVLEQNSFLPLFEHYAFGEEFILDEKMTSLRLIGKEIVKSLNGLPLAAVAVGSLLRQNLNRENWKNILESDWWNIGSKLGAFLPSLAVSLQQLDMELRLCFAFCSLLPRGIFTVDDMFGLWIAHDLIRPVMGQSNNLRGFMNERCNQLSERCLFLPVIRGATFYMPDSVRDLATALSSSDMCVL
ncbi:hypothetical protein LUZ60_010742 [Juncus effusus]|nr:hypothetical protein LUZ60_010742 [Juncus effusus]